MRPLSHLFNFFFFHNIVSVTKNPKNNTTPENGGSGGDDDELLIEKVLVIPFDMNNSDTSIGMLSEQKVEPTLLFL